MADTEQATLAGGCFWCLEAVFEQVRGVASVVSGYIGGTVPDPSYEQVCAGTTGHAEAVQVTFDPTVVSYTDLLQIFFSVHDPTTLDRQGGDVGTQYRSAIFTHGEAQRSAATRTIAALQEQGLWEGIVTMVQPAPRFFAAEEYHQGYYRTNPGAGYCRAVVGPKVAKFRSAWKDRLRS